MENDLIFVGFRNGTSKANKPYFMLNFITPPITSRDGNSAYCNNVSIFTEKDKYNDFLKNYSLLDTVRIPYEVNGDKVRYYL